MNTALAILAGLGVIALAFYLRLKSAINTRVEAVKSPPAVVPDDSVQCFSCGMVVAREQALEKKGRYFCGVKRLDREGNPIRRAD